MRLAWVARRVSRVPRLEAGAGSQVIRAVRGVAVAGSGSQRAARDREEAVGSGGGRGGISLPGMLMIRAPQGGDHGFAAADAVGRAGCPGPRWGR